MLRNIIERNDYFMKSNEIYIFLNLIVLESNDIFT